MTNSPRRAWYPRGFFQSPIQFRGVLFGEVPGKNRDIFGVIRNGGVVMEKPSVDNKDRFEEAYGRSLGQIAVGSGYDPDIDGNGLGTAHLSKAFS